VSTSDYASALVELLFTRWNGTWSQSGQDVTVTNASWNGTLADGAWRWPRLSGA
jgi:Cellulose binding domain